MSSDPSEDIKDLLVAAGVGIFAAETGWSINISKEPTKPDTAITIYPTGGTDPNPKFILDHPSVQVRVRGGIKDYNAGYAKAQAIKDALLGLPSQTVDGTVIVGVWMISDIAFLRYDDNDRPLFTTNWRLDREPATGTNRTAFS